MGQLIQELKRRNVIRAAVAYAVAAWILIEVTSTIFPILSLPTWSVTLVTVFLLIGFPLVLVFSWAYEITPEGIKKEKDVERSESITRETAKKLDIAVIVLLILAMGSLVADRLIPDATTPATEATADSVVVASVPDQSIAVLPFANMSADPDNEYFSDGLSEELLNLLAKIPELNVAARTSAFAFKEKDTDITEIARRLRVAYVLEGSVRQSGDRPRITAQLIDTSNGYHLWSDTRERKLTDVFAIQDEIAAAVVASLRLTLLHEMPRAQRTDPEAYFLFLKSKAQARLRTKEGAEEAVRLLARALTIDPEFASGWAALATVQVNNAFRLGRSPKETYAGAEASARRALSLDPENSTAMIMLGAVEMFLRWDFAATGKWFNKAREIALGDSRPLNALAVWTRYLGRSDAALALYQEAVDRDPLSVIVAVNLAAANTNAGRFKAARLQIEAMKQFAPDAGRILTSSAWLEFNQGNFKEALRYSDQIQGPDYILRACALHGLGRFAEAQAELDGYQQRNPARAVGVADIFVCWGEVDRAFEWLERA